MADNWAIEVHDTSGKPLFARPVVSAAEVKGTLAAYMTYAKTGGIVIYRSTVASGNDCETDEKENLENFGKVAQGNKEVAVGAMDYWPPDVAKGSCKTCGCPPSKMPMVNRGTGWCSETCRKEQVSKGNE